MHELLQSTSNFNFLINDNPNKMIYNAAVVEKDNELVVVVSRISLDDKLIQLEFEYGIHTVDIYLAEGYWIVIDERSDDLDNRIKSTNL
jgi:hypothetical protein